MWFTGLGRNRLDEAVVVHPVPPPCPAVDGGGGGGRAAAAAAAFDRHFRAVFRSHLLPPRFLGEFLPELQSFCVAQPRVGGVRE